MLSSRILGAAAAVVLLVGAQACTEQVNASLGCPSLCTDQSAELRDTILLGSIVQDTSLFGFPQLGESRDVTLISRGDTADLRFVARFDTLPTNYLNATSQDSAISRVDSATFMFVTDTTVAKPTLPFTVSAFDVDTVAADTNTAALLPLFRASRLLGSRTYAVGEAVDTIRIPLSSAKLLKKVNDTARLRIGVQISGTTSEQLRVIGSLYTPRVRFRVSADTLVHPDTVYLSSSTPVEDATLRSALALYSVIAKGKLPPPPANQLNLGGISGGRTFFRFDVPQTLVDSVQVVRASLLLQQTPARSTARTNDSIYVYTQPVVSAPSITDVRTIMGFLGNAFSYGIDSVLFFPKDSGLKSIELVNLVRYWRQVGAANSNRAIIIRPALEGSLPGEINIFSIEALPALRPRLRITYEPRRGFGLP